MEKKREEFPRTRLEHQPMEHSDRFKLALKFANIAVDNSGQLVVWLTRGEVSNLQHDCSVALFEDDVDREANVVDFAGREC